MAVLEMLSEVIRTVKLLAGITFAKFMHLLQVSQPLIPVMLRWVPRPSDTSAAAELLSTVSTCVSFTWPVAAVVESPIIS